MVKRKVFVLRPRHVLAFPRSSAFSMFLWSHLRARIRRPDDTLFRFFDSGMFCAYASIQAFAAGPTERIDPLDRVRRISIEVDAPRELDRVRRDEAAYARIVVTMPVIVQPRFFINLLPLKPCVLARRDAERLKWRVDRTVPSNRYQPRLARAN